MMTENENDVVLMLLPLTALYPSIRVVRYRYGKIINFVCSSPKLQRFTCSIPVASFTYIHDFRNDVLHCLTLSLPLAVGDDQSDRLAGVVKGTESGGDFLAPHVNDALLVDLQNFVSSGQTAVLQHMYICTALHHQLSYLLDTHTHTSNITFGRAEG